MFVIVLSNQKHFWFEYWAKLTHTGTARYFPVNLQEKVNRTTGYYRSVSLLKPDNAMLNNA